MNPLDALIQQLSQSAGPRGSTFAGRVIPQGKTPDINTLMATPPTDVPDAEGFGNALLAAGIPLANKMRIPQNVKLSQVLSKMYDDMAAKYPTPPTKDQWIAEKLTNIGLHSKFYEKGMPRPFSGAGITEGSRATAIPRTQQLAAVIDMADKSGMLERNMLAPMVDKMTLFGSPPKWKTGPITSEQLSQEYLDLLRNYLDLVKP